jgi:hypothetical protein
MTNRFMISNGSIQNLFGYYVDGWRKEFRKIAWLADHGSDVESAPFREIILTNSI